MDSFPVTERTEVRRRSQRGHYDRATIYSILDEAFLCHVGFQVAGRPVVIPTAYGRDGDCLILHGSPINRMLGVLAEGVEVSIAVTLIDAFVMARSVFHHSINYRSVVLFGRAFPINEWDAKMEALRIFTEHLTPGRWAEARIPDKTEMDATSVLSFAIEEASAKIRSGPPIDDEADMNLDVWAGLLPLSVQPGPPIPDPQLAAGIEVAPSVRRWSRGEVTR